MTRKRNTIAAAGILIALLIGGYYGAKAYRAAKFAKLTSAAQSIDLAKLDSDKVVKIEVPTAGLTLQKQDKTWETVPKSDIRLNQEEIGSVTWSLSNMRADKIIDEAPKDLAAYGLDSPKSRVIVTTSEGASVEYIAGNMTPSKSGYYAMMKGDPKVYAVPSYPGERLYLKAGDVRDKKLPAFEPQDVKHFILTAGKSRIEIEAKSGEDALVSSFTSHIMTSPYKTKRGVDPERFGSLLMFFKGLEAREFVDDKPASLVPYGLDKPRRVFVQADTTSLNLLVGKMPEGSSNRLYAKLDGEPGVFTIDDISPALAATAFDLIDRFALIIGIDRVDSFTVKADGRTMTGEIKREKTTVVEKDAEGKETTKEETRDTYYYNGKKADETTFKDFYQSCIGLVADAEHPAPTSKAAPADISIEYRMNTPAGMKAEVRFASYNRDFYALYRDGASELLVSKAQARKITEAADKIKLVE